MRVLHVTNWYPNKLFPKEALWIKRHVDSLSGDFICRVLHFEIFKRKLFFSFRRGGNISQLLIGLPFEFWRFNELLYFMWLFSQLVILRKSRNFDIINVHIAYPLLTYWKFIKPFISKPVVISEHWSAYHYNFGVPYRLPRIERVFSHKIPLITVSRSLARDIEEFSKTSLKVYILPNIVDDEFFGGDTDISESNYFFMVSQWKWPKMPLIAMKAFNYFTEKNNRKYQLRIAGHGPLYESMRSWIIENEADDCIKLLGPLSSNEIAAQMKKCKAVLHPTEYETFSVVCAEALSCGSKLLASKVGGIVELGLTKDDVLVEFNTVECWLQALTKCLNAGLKDAAINEYENFSTKKIGEQYGKILKEISLWK
ncbi:glycosyltransferase [Fulvivirga maritima]|uniref:glycosyltransferase n=1 Tax=Fulvivirga maritima TaxID=2904247 RepID=UPI001F2EA0EB|nr:glycosyltransferase [Fulvivirga maritima]UII27788.1 glycosyltransferase [Fulvivirga maritima]